MGALPPFEAPFQTPESPPLPRAEALCSLPACSNESFAFGTGGRTHPSPHGGRHEVRPRVLPFVRTPARRRWDCRGRMSEEVALCYFFCFISVCSDSIPCALRAGKGACYGGVAPLRGPFPNPRITPPYLALRLCVHCPPVPTKASLSEQAGAHIHPRMGGGMKSGQGCYPSCVPRPAVGGIAGGRARPEKNRAPGRAVRREGCRYDVGPGRAPPCDPVSASPSVPKAKLLLEHEDAGRTGRRSTLKGKGDSGGGCKEGPRGGNRRFPTTGPSLALPGGHRG